MRLYRGKLLDGQPRLRLVQAVPDRRQRIPWAACIAVAICGGVVWAWILVTR